MEFLVKDTDIHFSEVEADFVVHVANDTCLSIHDLILLSVLSFCDDEDRCIAIRKDLKSGRNDLPDGQKTRPYHVP